MKKTFKLAMLICVVLLSFIMMFAACDSQTLNDTINGTTNAHTHEYGEWYTSQAATCTIDGVQERTCECGDKETQHIPATNKHTIVNGKCNSCEISIIKSIGEIIKSAPDQYTSGSYIKSFMCSDFSSQEDAINCGIGFAYNENTQTMLIQLTKSSASGLSVDTITVIINNGVIANRYDYSYSHTNNAGSFTDKIEGVFSANALSYTSSFDFNNYSAGSGTAIKYFIKNYQEDAAKYTKQLFVYLDEFFKYQKLPFTSNDLNVK